MKKRFLVASLVVVLAAVMTAVAGCTFPGCGSQPRTGPAPVSILGVRVTPPSGDRDFQLSITYQYDWNGKDLPEHITFFVDDPDQEIVFRGTVIPPIPAPGNQGKQVETATIPFAVQPGPGGITQSGTYTATARGESGGTEDRTTFRVTGQTEAATTTTTGGTGPVTWSVRVYNADDHGAAYVNGALVAQVDFNGDSGWIDVTSYFSAASTSVRFTMVNDLQGYAWGFAIKRNDTIVWQDEQGQVNVAGANNNDQTRENQTVYDRTFSVSQDGQVSQAP